jgi:hypothetical protein
MEICFHIPAAGGGVIIALCRRSCSRPCWNRFGQDRLFGRQYLGRLRRYCRRGAEVFVLPTLLAAALTSRNQKANVESFFSDNSIFTVNSRALASYDPRISYCGWSFATPASTLANCVFGGTILQASVAASAFNFAPSVPVNKVEIHDIESSTAGTMQIQVDGVTVQTLNLRNASPGTKKIVLDVALGMHTISAVAGGGGNAFLSGMICWDTTRPSLCVINAGKSGGFTNQHTESTF